MDGLGADIWQKHYNLMYSLHFDLSECQFIQSKKDVAEQHFNTLLANANSRYDKAKYVLFVFPHAHVIVCTLYVPTTEHFYFACKCKFAL